MKKNNLFSYDLDFDTSQNYFKSRISLRNTMRLFVFVSIFFNFYTALSQNSKIEFKITLNMGPGVAMFSDVSTLNTELTGLGYPALKKAIPVSTGGVGVWINNFYVEALSNSYSMKKINSTDASIKFDGNSSEFLLAYNFLKAKRMKLFPMLGVGNLSSLIYIDPKTTPDFVTGLSGSGTTQSKRIDISDISAGIIGVGADFKIKSLLNDYADLKATFRCKYLACSSGDWRINNQLVTAPSSTLSSVNISLGLQMVIHANKILK